MCIRDSPPSGTCSPQGRRLPLLGVQGPTVFFRIPGGLSVAAATPSPWSWRWRASRQSRRPRAVRA
eukprot:9218683-Alexandrium_andersonii.AAC.1